MPKQVKYIAQTALDDFYQNFTAPTDFFSLEDMIIRVGNAAGTYYLQAWKQYYDELRAERINAEVVCFDSESLAEQIVKVKSDGSGAWVGVLERQAMSLPFDQQTSGFSNVFDAKTGEELERSNINETWQYKYQPTNNRKFFRIERDKIKIFTKGICNIQEVRVLFVPSIKIGDGDEWIPDGIVGYCIASTVSYMRSLAGRPIKKSLDLNENESMQSEMNKEQIK